MTEGMWRRIIGPRGLVGFRRALFVAALLSLVTMQASLLLSHEGSAAWCGAAAAALVYLGLRWWRLYRTERGGTAWDVAEAAAIAGLGVAIGADNAIPVVLAGLAFRSQYGARAAALRAAAGYAGAFVFAAALANPRYPDFSPVSAAMQVPLLLMVAGAAAEFARGVRAIEAGVGRERLLARTVSTFLDVRERTALAALAEEAIDEACGTRIGARAVLLDAAGTVATRTRYGSGAIELPVAGTGAIFVLPWAPLGPSRMRWLATLADQVALAASVIDARAAAAEQQIQQLVERNGGVAVRVDAELTVHSATPGVRELLGRAPEELVGRPVVDVVHRGDRDRTRDALRSVVGGDETAPERVTVRLTGDARPRWAELSLADLGSWSPGQFVVQVRDVTARVALEEDARRREDHDALTGLPNRERFEIAVADHLRNGDDHIAIVLIDLDDFRRVNETLGHAAGDEVLAEAARRLAYTVSGDSLVARLAGDTFAVLQAEFDPEAVPRLLGALAAPFSAASGTLRLSATAGVARAGGELRDTKALVAAAGAALAAADTEAKGDWLLFAPEHHARRMERAMLQAELADAIGAGQLELDYQPLVDAHTGQWRSAEALVRWRHPELGRLGPQRFIELAEESELIVAVGQWVLHEACRRLAEWRVAHVVPPEFSVAVNVSGIQAARDDLVLEVQSALEHSGLPAACLTLELTETAVVDVRDLAGRLERLRRLGVRIAIDDFGTGHSSLAYLKDLPADIVKLPRPFVRDIGGPGRSAEIIHGLVGLARPLGLTVVAEGVETRSQRDGVVAAGCELIQGYLFATPMPPGEFVALAPSGTVPFGQLRTGGRDDDPELAQRLARAAQIAGSRLGLQ
jgi:diguanylate cyclase (GGDEF)-like protein/PAS domain S-box-containing protein